MPTFIALYHGDTVSGAKMVAVSMDPSLVAHVARELIGPCDAEAIAEEDPILQALLSGRSQALRLIKIEAEGHD